VADSSSATVEKPKSIDAVVQRITEISTLPQVALKVIEVAKDPDAGAAELKAVVEGDPALSARVLRMVNSAAYAVRSRVTNLHQAISYLGFNQVRNLAMTASVSELFKKKETLGPYRRSTLWRHLVSVGICARLVASRCKMANFEDAFLAGLLHDIGIILEDQHVHPQFAAIMQELSDNPSLLELEKKYLGFTHCMLGARIAETWRFPDVVRAAIRFHHASLSYRDEGADIVRCVEVANVLCTVKGITSVGIKTVKPQLEVFQAMGFQKEDLVILAQDLDQELVANESLFEL